MPQTFHVNGPAQVNVLIPAGVTNTPSGITAGSLVPFGISGPDGIDITITTYDEPVMTDAAGSKVPAEIQAMGSDAIIRGIFPIFDDLLWAFLVSRYSLAIGTPLGGNSGTFKLNIPSTQDQPWTFNYVVVRGESTESGDETLALAARILCLELRRPRRRRRSGGTVSEGIKEVAAGGGNTNPKRERGDYPEALLLFHKRSWRSS